MMEAILYILLADKQDQKQNPLSAWENKKSSYYWVLYLSKFTTISKNFFTSLRVSASLNEWGLTLDLTIDQKSLTGLSSGE